MSRQTPNTRRRGHWHALHQTTSININMNLDKAGDRTCLVRRSSILGIEGLREPLCMTEIFGACGLSRAQTRRDTLTNVTMILDEWRKSGIAARCKLRMARMASFEVLTIRSSILYTDASVTRQHRGCAPVPQDWFLRRRYTGWFSSVLYSDGCSYVFPLIPTFAPPAEE